MDELFEIVTREILKSRIEMLTKRQVELFFKLYNDVEKHTDIDSIIKGMGLVKRDNVMKQVKRTLMKNRNLFINE